MIGVFAAWGHRMGLLLLPQRAWWISFGCVAVLLTISSVTWLSVQREQIALWMAESPETYRWRDLMLGSQTTALSVGPIFALAVAYPIWAVWRWWYTRLGKWWKADSSELAPPSKGAVDSGEDHRTYAQRLAELKRGAAPAGSSPVPAPASSGQSSPGTLSLPGAVQSNSLLVVLAVLAIGFSVAYLLADRYHQEVALRLEHGIAFVDTATQPQAEFPVRVDPDVQRLRIVNIKGEGAVRVFVSQPSTPLQSVAESPEWAFEWRSDEYLYQDLPVADLAPGDYTLNFVQESGWGYFEYLLSHGGGPTSNVLAVAAGFLFACSLLLAAALIALVAARVWSAVS